MTFKKLKIFIVIKKLTRNSNNSSEKTVDKLSKKESAKRTLIRLKKNKSHYYSTGASGASDAAGAS